jgi:broad specificity polyphosphatase/5'/3'-nucleotidase SurE
MEEKSFTIGRMLNHSQSTLSSDLETIKQNKISISPLLLNLTNENFLNNN